MDLLLLVSLVIYVEQCLFSCVTGHLRTSNFISYIKPEMYHNNRPGSQAYPVWHRLWKKHSRDQSIRHKLSEGQFSKHYTRDYGTKNEIHTSKHKPEKRFLQYLPFLLDRAKQTYSDKHTKSSSRVKPFVDHFAGVRSWAVPFFIAKQTEPNSAIKPQSYEDFNNQQDTTGSMLQDEVENIDSTSNSDRVDKLELVEKMISRLSTGSSSGLPTDDKIEPNYQPLQQDGYEDYKSTLLSLTNDEMPENSEYEQNTLYHDAPYVQDGVTFIENNTSDNNMAESAEQQLTSKKYDQFSTLDELDGFQKDSSPDFVNWDDAGTVSSDIDSKPYSGFEDSFADSTNDYAWADGFGAFETDDSDCDIIDTKTCSSDFECNCYGIYFCIQGKCKTSGDDTVYDDGDFQDVFWHEGPVDV